MTSGFWGFGMGGGLPMGGGFGMGGSLPMGGGFGMGGSQVGYLLLTILPVFYTCSCNN